MQLRRLIYSSVPFGFDQSMLNGILVTSRDRNARDSISGALICRADLFLQYLEGPSPEIAACYARIARDDRHVEVKKHLDGPVAERLFGDWAMLDDPARSWVWSQDEVADGALDRATEAEVSDIFLRVRREVGQTA